MAKFLYGDRLAKKGKVVLACAAVIFDESGERVLLIRRTDNGRWALPGGALDPGETVTEACIREVKEETGLDIEVEHLFGIYSDPNRLLVYADGNQYHLVSLCFRGRASGGEFTLNPEASDIKWVALNDLDTLDLMDHHVERIRDAFSAETLVK